MVRIELSDSDIALISAAEHHRANCDKCRKATTLPAWSKICLPGLLYFSKIMRMFRMNDQLHTAERSIRMGDTPC